MLFGQLFCRRLRRGIDDGKIEMSVGVIGIVGDGFEYFSFRRFLPALLARSDAEIIVRGGALGIDRERLGQLGERVIEFGLPIIDDAEGGVGKLVPGSDGNGFLQRQLGGFKSGGAKINDAKIGKRVEVIGTLGQDFLILFFRRSIFAMLEVIFCRLRQIPHIPGHIRVEGALRVSAGIIGRRRIPAIRRFLRFIRARDFNCAHG